MVLITKMINESKIKYGYYSFIKKDVNEYHDDYILHLDINSEDVIIIKKYEKRRYKVMMMLIEKRLEIENKIKALKKFHEDEIEERVRVYREQLESTPYNNAEIDKLMKVYDALTIAIDYENESKEVETTVAEPITIEEVEKPIVVKTEEIMPNPVKASVEETMPNTNTLSRPGMENINFPERR